MYPNKPLILNQKIAFLVESDSFVFDELKRINPLMKSKV